MSGTLSRALLLVVSLAALGSAQTRTRNVIFVMSDGMRWQEVFRGVDPDLMRKESGVDDPAGFRKSWWRDDVIERRRALMPFLWGTVAAKGQIYGNQDANSEAHVTNTMFFSYPGYNEILCGFADDERVNSNDKNYNPNVNVLEWLNAKPAFKGRIAAFGAWDAFPWILNAPRSGLVVNAGFDPLTVAPVTPALKLLNRLKVETEMWDGETFDSFTFHTALEYLKLHKPRVLFLSLGETDEWAHAGKYELYVKSAHRVDANLRELWETVQAMPEYRGTTSLIVGVDHGRGQAPDEWKSHGQKVPDSRFVWMAFLGPDTRPLGARQDVAPVTQSQVAATLAALLGEDYRANGKPGRPIGDVLPVSAAKP